MTGSVYTKGVTHENKDVGTPTNTGGPLTCPESTVCAKHNVGMLV